MEPIWQETAKRPCFGALERDTKTDVLVIGGGMAGLLCAHRLQREGVDCLLVEAGRICGGVTGSTTAKLTVQHGLIYDKLMKTFGADTARLYYEANRDALDRYRDLCRDLDCDWEEADNFVYARQDRDKLERELAALQRIGAPATLETELPLPFQTVGAVKLPGQAQFHPLKFAFSLAKSLNIREHTKVLELAPHRAKTDRGEITAGTIIVATHFPMLNKHGAFFLKLYQHRSYVLALRNAGGINGMYVDESHTGLSFRPYGDLLLLGGGGHRTGKPGGGWTELRTFAKAHYPQAEEVAHWATQDCMSLDGVPYIGPYSAAARDLLVATGFNKWGMTSSMAAASILTDLVLGRNNPYAPVFSPSRSTLRPQLAVNAAEALAGLLRPTAPRCPHMGCALHYNRAEHSWDCSCHGSRFTEHGRLLDNPASGDKPM